MDNVHDLKFVREISSQLDQYKEIFEDIYFVVMDTPLDLSELYNIHDAETDVIFKIQEFQAVARSAANYAYRRN